LGVLAFIVAAAAHAFIWSGGMLVLPLAWMLAILAIGLAYFRTPVPLSTPSWWGLSLAIVVLIGSLIELAVLAVRA
jgi:hypothetical protein